MSTSNHTWPPPTAPLSPATRATRRLLTGASTWRGATQGSMRPTTGPPLPTSPELRCQVRQTGSHGIGSDLDFLQRNATFKVLRGCDFCSQKYQSSTISGLILEYYVTRVRDQQVFIDTNPPTVGCSISEGYTFLHF